MFKLQRACGTYCLLVLRRYKAAINAFVENNDHLLLTALDDDDWIALTVAADWLSAFRGASIQMSTTSRPMLSQVLLTYHGLLAHIKDKIAALPDETPDSLRDALVAAHEKLACYHYKTDTSPYYIWAACKLGRV